MLGGGSADVTLLIVLGVLLLPVVLAVTGRRAGPVALTASLTLLQGVMHVVLSLTAGPAPQVVGPTSGHVHHVSVMPVGHAMEHSVVPDGRMLLAHVLATLALVLVVTRSEVLLRAALRALVPALPRVVAVPAVLVRRGDFLAPLPLLSRDAVRRPSSRAPPLAA